MKLNVIHVPALDTGLGREAGYTTDAELIDASQALEAELNELLSPKGRALLEDAEREFERKILGLES